MRCLAALVFSLVAVSSVRAQSLTATSDADPATASSSRRVVVLYDERTDLPGLAILDATLVSSLRSGPGGPIDVYREAMDLSRFGSATYLQVLRDYLRAKYAAKKIDLVVAVMGPALEFLVRHGDELFPGAPIVFCGIDKREFGERSLPANVTGVMVEREFAPTLDMALRIHPDTTRVAFVAGSSEFDVRLVEQAREEFRPYEDRVAFTYLTTLPFSAVLAEVANLPPHTVVLYSTFFRDGAGYAFVPHEVAERISAAANVPVYGFLDQYLGRGIVGGHLYSLEAHGKQAAAMARQILAGKLPSELPQQDGGASFDAFDWRQMRRWGITEARLPSGSSIQFRTAGTFERYKVQIIGAGLLLALQTALIGTLLFQRTRRLRTEKALEEGRQRYALASAAGAVGVWDWNFETNELFIDSRLKAILGFDDAEISTRPEDWGSRVHPQDVPASTAAVKACMDGHTDAYQVEHRMLHKNGSVRWMLSRGAAIRSADGRLRRLVGTKVDITERKDAEESIHENHALLRESHRQVQDLAGRLIASQEVERARLARDLHDDLSQQTAGLSIALSAFKRRLGAQPEAGDLLGDVSSLQERALGLAENIRNLSHDLHPSVLQHAGLVAALTAHCSDIQRQYMLIVTFSAGENVDVTPALALCLYRVTQEALRNVVTHSGASHAEVRLLRLIGHVELTIEDNGRGFDTHKARKGSRGLGLVSIDERVRLAGGTASIMTELGKGTRVRVQIPAAAHALAAPQV